MTLSKASIACIALLLLTSAACDRKSNGRQESDPAAGNQLAAPAAEAEPAPAAKTDPANPGAGKVPGSTAEPEADAPKEEPVPAEADPAKDTLRKEQLVKSPHLPAPGKGVVAWRETRQISTEEFQRYLNRLPPFQRREYAALEKKMELLKNLIKFETLAEMARAEGFDNDPDVQLALKTEMVKKLIQSRYGQDAKVEISDDQIQARYEKDHRRYHKPERVRVSHIFVTDEGTAKQVLEELKATIEKPGSNTRKVFREFVNKYSEDETSKRRGGDLLFFSREQVASGEKKIDPAVVEAAFVTPNTNQVSSIISGADGYHIIMLTNRRAKIDQSLDQVKEDIRAHLKRETLDRRRKQFMDQVVDYDEWHMEMNALGKIQVEADPSSHDVDDRVKAIGGDKEPAEAGK